MHATNSSVFQWGVASHEKYAEIFLGKTEADAL